MSSQTARQHPYLRAEDIAALARLLENDIRFHPKIVSPREVARWMDADARFASYVEENHPGMAEVASAYRAAASPEPQP